LVIVDLLTIVDFGLLIENDRPSFNQRSRIDIQKRFNNHRSLNRQ